MKNDFSFLEKEIVAYYQSLNLNNTFDGNCYFLLPEKQLLYIKVLSMVVDRLIVAPASYIHFFNYIKNPKDVENISKFYEADILFSPIYVGMNSGLNYLEYKEKKGSKIDKKFIERRRHHLVYLYKNFPIVNRDVRNQSFNFKVKLESNLKRYCSSNYMFDSLMGILNKPVSDNIFISRESFMKNVNAMDFSSKNLKRIFSIMNKSYFSASAEFYFAFTSVLGASEYSSFGIDSFGHKNGILVGYDPLVILKILDTFGISEADIADLTVDDIINIRNSKENIFFRKEYYNFSIELQSLIYLESKKQLQFKNKIFNLERDITINFTKKYFSEEKYFNESFQNLNFFQSTLLGSVITVLTSVFGASLPTSLLAGALPSAVSYFEVDKYVGNEIISKIGDKNIFFFNFIQKLKYFVSLMKK